MATGTGFTAVDAVVKVIVADDDDDDVVATGLDEDGMEEKVLIVREKSRKARCDRLRCLRRRRRLDSSLIVGRKVDENVDDG